MSYFARGLRKLNYRHMEQGLKSNKKLISGVFIGLGIGLLASYFALRTTPPAPDILISGNIIPIESIQNNEGSYDGKALGNYLASRSGTKYYPVGCKSANRIKEENRIWFSDIESAQNAGYEPASNCSF